MVVLLLIAAVFCIITAIEYTHDIRAAYERLDSYPEQSIDTQFGKMSFIDNGSGEAVLLSHGIVGGYDQGYGSIYGFLGDSCRKIAPSRFGYPGSDVPDQPTPDNQAKAYVELLDKLNIDKAFVITTSAGGGSGIMMAINYPERVKGLIMMSSGMPNTKRKAEDITEMTGPPSIMGNDFPMWFTLKHFGFVMDSMMGIKERTKSIFDTILPVSPRKKGIQIDTTITNKDMDLKYDAYPVEQIKAPILMIHAKDDPMVKYETTINFQKRTNPQTLIFETGGHLINGHADEVSQAVKNFIETNK